MRPGSCTQPPGTLRGLETELGLSLNPLITPASLWALRNLGLGSEYTSWHRKLEGDASGFLGRTAMAT